MKRKENWKQKGKRKDRYVSGDRLLIQQGLGVLAPLCNALSVQWRVTSPSLVSHTS